MNTPDMNAMNRWADVRNTSIEVARAIFEISGDDDTAANIWEDADDAVIAQVAAIAWPLADPSQDTLHWGDTKLHRPE